MKISGAVLLVILSFLSFSFPVHAGPKNVVSWHSFNGVSAPQYFIFERPLFIDGSLINGVELTLDRDGPYGSNFTAHLSWVNSDGSFQNKIKSTYRFDPFLGCIWIRLGSEEFRLADNVLFQTINPGQSNARKVFPGIKTGGLRILPLQEKYFPPKVTRYDHEDEKLPRDHHAEFVILNEPIFINSWKGPVEVTVLHLASITGHPSTGRSFEAGILNSKNVFVSKTSISFHQNSSGFFLRQTFMNRPLDKNAKNEASALLEYRKDANDPSGSQVLVVFKNPSDRWKTVKEIQGSPATGTSTGPNHIVLTPSDRTADLAAALSTQCSGTLSAIAMP